MMSNSLLVSIWSLICVFVICSGRTPQLIGGWSDLHTNDTSVKNVTDFAVDMYNKKSNSINMKQLVTIKSAKSQLVAGRKFSITFAVGETNCSKNGIQRNNHRECPLTNTSTVETCTAIIWQRVWLNSTILQDLKCCPSERTDC